MLQLSIIVPGLLGLFFAWLPLIAFHYSLASYGYDGSVYYGASVQLAHGVFPYRDYVFVQPPGITLLLLPIALLSRITSIPFAFSVSHAFTLVIMGLNCSLVAFALRFKGALASFVGGMTCALFVWSMTDDFTVKLEPFLLLFCLLAVIIAFSEGRPVSGRRVLLVGVALGLAGTVKVWAIFPALVMIALYAIYQRKELIRLCLGMCAGFGVPSLPFFLAAPGAFVHDVIASQATRGSSTFAPLGNGSTNFSVIQRLKMLSNYAFNPIFSGRALVGVVAILLIVGTYVVRRRTVSPFEWFTLAALFVTVASLLVPGEFPTYFAYFPEVFLALVLGGVVAVWASALGRLVKWATPAIRTDGHARPLRITQGVVLLVVVALIGVSVPGIVNAERSYSTAIQYVGPLNWIDSNIPVGSCVVTDFPYFTIAANRFISANSGCPVIIDPYGTWLAANPSNPPPSPAYLVPSVTDDWRTWFAAANYVILNSVGNQWVPWTPSLQSWFNLNFVEVGASGPVTIYQNRNFTAG